MKRFGALLVVVVVGAGGSSRALAQGQPVERSVEVELFEPAVGPGGYVSVIGGGVLPHLTVDAGLFGGYQHDPLRENRVYGDQLEPAGRVVGGQVVAHLVGAIGLFDRLQVELGLPVVPYQSGDGVDAMGAADGLPSSSGIGDLRIGARTHLLGGAEGASMALAVPVTLPTGNDDAFLGERSITVRPLVALELRRGRASGAINAGYLWRLEDTELFSSRVGDQILYAAAAAYQLAAPVDGVIELSGRHGFSSDLDDAPLELRAAVRYRASARLAVAAGAGAGLVQGIGSPDVRAFAGVTWTAELARSQ